jgi:ankyrin repeat protein
MMCSLLSRDKGNPTLLITSAEGTPEWVASSDALTLAVGLCDFTCCQRNHTFPGIGVVPCDRDITREILETLITSKVENLYKTDQIKLARLFHCMTQWWTRRPSPSTRVKRCDSLAELKRQLMWNESIDGQDSMAPWTDRYKISILVYGVLINEINIVREILEHYKNRRTSLLESRFPKDGVSELGIPGHETCLIEAMSFASPEIVVVLLDAGATVDTENRAGSDPLIAACVMGRLENVNLWFSKVKWDVNRRNILFGSTALNCALYMGTRKLELVRYLIEKQNARVYSPSNTGASALTLACENQDADPKVIRYLLQNGHVDVNVKVRPRSIKMKVFRRMCVLVTRAKLSRSRKLAVFARGTGATALHFAAQRGDLEIIELLMGFGAEPSIKNDLGRDVLSYCKAFPEIKGAIKRVKREAGRVQRKITDKTSRETRCTKTSTETKKKTNGFTLQRRLSTATPVKYDMYVLNVSTMFALFEDEEDRKKNMNLCHQDLLETGKLIRFEDLPMGAFVMFVSHQWNGFDHPDPNGVQMSCMAQIFQHLRDGKIDRVDTDLFHTILYKEKTTTPAKEWQEMFLNAYVWYDFWSQPQPTMAKSGDTTALDRNLSLAINSVSAYVERSDCVVVLVPGAVHKDRSDPRSGRRAYTNYRTYRRRYVFFSHPSLPFSPTLALVYIYIFHHKQRTVRLGDVCVFPVTTKNASNAFDSIFERCPRMDLPVGVTKASRWRV